MLKPVRRATHDDIPRLVVMGRKFHEKAEIPAPYSEAATSNLLAGLIDSPDGAVFVTDAGMIGGMLAPAYCSTDWRMAVELFWWAEDRSGLRLLAMFEKWAQNSGANEIRMTTIAGLETATRILDRRGYRPIEISHIKVI